VFAALLQICFLGARSATGLSSRCAAAQCTMTQVSRSSSTGAPTLAVCGEGGGSFKLQVATSSNGMRLLGRAASQGLSCVASAAKRHGSATSRCCLACRRRPQVCALSEQRGPPREQASFTQSSLPLCSQWPPLLFSLSVALKLVSTRRAVHLAKGTVVQKGLTE